MRITTLGCSGGIGAGSRTSALLIDDDVLLDAGTGVGDLELHDMKAIRHVFLTHSHLDHVAGLAMLIDVGFDENGANPVTVYARRETLEAISAHLFNDVIWPDFAMLPDADRPMLRYQELNPGETVAVGKRTFTAIDVRHSVPSLGFTIANSKGVIAVSGDTTTNDTLWPVLNSCDDLRALVIEVSFADEQESLATVAGHYCPATLCRDLRRLEKSPDIWLTGMKPGHEDRIFHQVLARLPDRQVQMLSRGTVVRM